MILRSKRLTRRTSLVSACLTIICACSLLALIQVCEVRGSIRRLWLCSRMSSQGGRPEEFVSPGWLVSDSSRFKFPAPNTLCFLILICDSCAWVTQHMGVADDTSFEVASVMEIIAGTVPVLL